MMNKEIISLSIVLGMRSISDKSCGENQNTFYVYKLFFENAFLRYCGRAGQVTADNMAHARCVLITKASETHSEYVVLTAVSLQEWLHERASRTHFSR